MIKKLWVPIILSFLNWMNYFSYGTKIMIDTSLLSLIYNLIGYFLLMKYDLFVSKAKILFIVLQLSAFFTPYLIFHFSYKASSFITNSIIIEMTGLVWLFINYKKRPNSCK
jgi:hypothetical protein